MRTAAIALCTIIMLAPPASAGLGLVTKKSAHSVPQTLNRLENALKEKGIVIFARIDHAAGAQKAGMHLRPTELLIFGNPKLGTPLMQSKQTIGIDLPLRVLVWEDEKGQVWLAYTDPASLAARYGITDKPEVVTKMNGALKKFTDIATQP